MPKINENLQIQPGVSGPINQTLIADLKKVADVLDNTYPGFVITITSGNRGSKDRTASGNLSRHATGNAVDIASINGVAYKTNQTEFTKLGNIVVGELVKLGYRQVNGESGVDRAILWQTKDHFNHIHVSNKNGTVYDINTNDFNSSDTSGLPQDTTKLTNDNILDIKGDPFVSSLFKGTASTNLPIQETYLFSNSEDKTNDHIKIHASNDNEIIFPFQKGKVLSKNINNNIIDITIYFEYKNESYTIVYHDIEKTTLNKGSIVHKLDIIGVSNTDVIVEFKNRFNKVVNPSKFDIDDDIDDDVDDEYNNRKNYKDTSPTKYKRFGSATSRDSVTDKWIYKQIRDYVKNKWKKK